MPFRRATLPILAAALAFGPASAAAQQFGGLDLLAVPAGARAASLAEALTAAGEDVEAVLYNPAAISGTLAGLAISRADAPDLYQHYLFAAGVPVRRVGNLAAFARVLTFEAIPLRDESGAPLGEISPQALAVGVTAARRLFGVLDAGLSLKFVSVDLAAGSSGAALSADASGPAFDLGIAVRPLPGVPLSLGAAVLDLGPALDIGNGSDALPRRLRLGAALEPLALLRQADEAAPVRALLLLDREQGLAEAAGDAEFRFGAEVRLMDILSLRGGLGPGGDGVDRTRQVFGLGVSLRRLRLDIAYESTASPALEDQTHVSLGFRL